MRNILRTGVIALAAGSLLLTGAVAAQAAPGADAVTFSIGSLVLDPGESGYAGALSLTITNGTDTEFERNVVVTEPIAHTFGTIDVGGPCGYNLLPDGRHEAWCAFDPIPAGETRTFTLGFRAPAASRPYARISAHVGTVQLAGVTEEFRALYRSSTGSVENPVAYTPETDQELAVTAGDVVLTRQEDGTFEGRVPVAVRNTNDVPHFNFIAQLAVPAGIDSRVIADDDTGTCSGTTDLPVPPGGVGATCDFGYGVDEGVTHTVEWIITAPADAPVGPLGTGTASADLSNTTAIAQTDGANEDTFAVTLAD